MDHNRMDSTQRIQGIDPGMARGKAKELLDAVVNTAALRTLSKRWPIRQPDFRAFSVFPERLKAAYCRSRLDTKLR